MNQSLHLAAVLALLHAGPAWADAPAGPAAGPLDEPRDPRLEVLVQALYGGGTAPAFAGGARLLRANVWLRGRPLPWLGYWLMVDPAKRLKPAPVAPGADGALATGPRDESLLQDGYVTLGMAGSFLEVGQMRPALSEDALTPFAELPLPARPLFNGEQAGFGFFRDLGVLATTRGDWGAVSLGVFNGEGPGVPDRSAAKDLNARLVVTPLPGLRLAAATYQGAARARHDASVRYRLGGLEFAAEGILGTDGAAAKQGWMLQASQRLPASLMAVGRYEGWDPGDPARLQRDATLGLNWFLDATERQKLVVAYTYQDVVTGDDNHRLEALVQVMR